MTITQIKPEIPRDGWKRPLVVPPEGGKRKAYTRCTTYVSGIEDLYNLQRWEKRMVALGLAERPDLMLSVLAHRDDKEALNRLCDDAKEVAKAHAAATTGTALHSLTEQIDRGQEMPPGLPANVRASLDAYAETTAKLKATHIEAFCVLDPLQIGGTPDRVVKYEGETYIADLKTGDIQWGALKIAAQLAVYSRSRTYDVVTNERGMHNASTTRGIVIHLPTVEDPADAVCTLHWIDLVAGWEAVKVCRSIREKRAIKFADLMTPIGEPTLTEVLEASIAMISLEKRIAMCKTPDEVRALWSAHANEWTDVLTEAAKVHIFRLGQAS